MGTRQWIAAISTSLLLAALGFGGSARAGDTGVGVDTWQANKLDPTAGAASWERDARGTSWLQPNTHRTPTGNLYLCPAAPPAPDEHGDWQYYGVLQIGFLATSGDDRNFLYNRYVDWDDGLVLGLFELRAERPSDGSYIDLRASRISDHDQYVKLRAGRAGAYQVDAFARDLPNVLSDNAKPIWNGVGTNNLTLPSTLTPGGSTSAQVAAVSAATPQRTLQVNRDKQGIGINYYFDKQWTAYANVTDEQRKGERPFGGVFFFNFPFPDNGGILETVKPIDDSTININGGVRYVGTTWRMDFGYSGSFYRDRYTRLDYQSPFALYPVVPGATSAPLYQGEYATEPDNDYHNLRATFTRALPWNGELSLTGSGATMRQNDNLLAPITCRGSFGIDLTPTGSPVNPFLYPCSDWNTTAALSRKTADMRIDTTLADARIVLQPTTDWTWRGGVKFYREDYRNTYLAYNPLTGQYGYVSENGAQGSVVPGESGIFDPLGDPSSITRVRSVPLDMQTIEANAGADWKLGSHDTLGATFLYTDYRPDHRERQRADAGSVKVTWVDRRLDWATLRVNYTYLKQTGDRYNYDPYDFSYSISLPGFVPPAGGVPAHTVDAMRKYDLSSRDEHKVDVMATVTPRDDMTLTGSLRGDWNAYDAAIGRHALDTLGFTLQWEWQPSTASRATLYYAYDHQKLALTNVNEALTDNPDPSLGGPSYPFSGVWNARDRETNNYFGATWTQDLGRVRLDASWTFTGSRGIVSYDYASALALAWVDPGQGDGPGSGRFPALTYRVNALNVGIVVPFTERLSMRVFDLYERGHISDWHYAGFDQTRVYDHRVYTDGGPTSYSANLIGLLLDVRL